MRKSISIWAFTADKSLEQCFAMAKDAGYDGVELAYATDGFITPGMSEADLAGIVALAKQYGLALPAVASGIFWGVNPISDDANTRTEAKKHAYELLRAAHFLGAKTVLFVPGSVGPIGSGSPLVADYEVAYNRAIADVKEIAKDAERFKVNLGIENVWNRFLVSPLEMRAFVDAVGSPYVGVYFDVGNVLRTGYPEQWIRILGKRIKGVHFKDYRSSTGTLDGFVELLEGDVNYKAVMAELSAIGYDGHAVVEYFPAGLYPDAAIYRGSRAVDIIFGGKIK